VAKNKKLVSVTKWDVKYPPDQVLIVLRGADGSEHPFQFDRRECMRLARQILQLEESP
jgi:hypothetical protein